MRRLFTLDEARAELPRLLSVAEEVIALRADLVDATARLRDDSESVNLADMKGAEARLAELLDGLTASGIQVKGYAPLLVDFPSLHDGREVLLCWLEGETGIDWYHLVEFGFAGRRRLDV